MHPKLIQYHLHRAGHSPARLARDLRVSHVAINHVIYGHHKSFRIAYAICKAAGLWAKEAFPGQYPLLDYQLRIEGFQPYALQDAA